MRLPVFVRLAALVACLCSFSGCVVVIPAVVEAVNENRIRNESEGAVLESNTGELKLIAQNDTLSTDKLNAYIQGYNSIMQGPWSLWPSYHTLINHTLKARENETIAFPVVGGLEKGLAFFKKGIALKEVPLPELDQAVTESLKAGEKLLTDEKTSLPYFRQQIYRRDGLSGGRKVFPVLKADYENLIAAMNRVGHQLMALQKQETERRMTAYQAQKNLIGYYTEKSLLHAHELVTLFDDPENSIPNPENDLRGDELVVQMENALKAQRKILDDLYPLRDTSSGVDGIASSLTGMAGSYRHLKKNRTARSFNLMMKRYSDAITHYNRSIKFNRPLP